MTKSPKVDSFLERQTHWREEFEKLRELVLETGLDEDLKWGQPCYSREGKNVVLLHGFKHYVAILFHKGVLLKDPKQVLIQQTKNVQAARQIRFSSLAEVNKLAATVKAYVKEATQNELEGVKVPLKKTAEFEMPDEFRQELRSNPALQEAFQALTPGRQRGYLLYFSSAKQSKTRAERVEKHAPRILEGLGLDD